MQSPGVSRCCDIKSDEFPNSKSDALVSAPVPVPVPQPHILYEGENFARLLKLLRRGMESARLVDPALPDKLWLKQQFAIGVNDVTRALERMTPLLTVAVAAKAFLPPYLSTFVNRTHPVSSSVQLQAIFLASDCNPRWLTKHLPILASSRKVPLIFVKDKKGGSLRLGELVKLKTAIAIGIKARGNAINQLVEEILHGKQIHVGTEI